MGSERNRLDGTKNACTKSFILTQKKASVGERPGGVSGKGRELTSIGSHDYRGGTKTSH